MWHVCLYLTSSIHTRRCFCFEYPNKWHPQRVFLRFVYENVAFQAPTTHASDFTVPRLLFFTLTADLNIKFWIFSVTISCQTN